MVCLDGTDRLLHNVREENCRWKRRWAARLAYLDVDLILTFGGPATAAAKKATAKIPIVFLLVADPVAIGGICLDPIPRNNIARRHNMVREAARMSARRHP